MARPRRVSNASDMSNAPAQDQELGSMYDYLAKIILLGPSGSGKSCLLHRFVKNEWRILSSQTIGVEFATKIIKVGTGSRRQRIKLQLWDTAGTERFRSVSRSYYRGAAGAILVYDLASHASFEALPTFLNDARALASPNLTLLLAGNKCDLASESASRPPSSASRNDEEEDEDDWNHQQTNGTPISQSQKSFMSPSSPLPTVYKKNGSSAQKTTSSSNRSSIAHYPLSSRHGRSRAPFGREVTSHDASRWASASSIPVSVEVSAFSGEGVNDVFERLARMILTKIELGEIDPDDPQSGIQYGDMGAWEGEDGSIKSGVGSSDLRRRRGKGGGGGNALSEWGEVFRFDAVARGRKRVCC
ncbi:hypothetical protein MMC25_003294 [Agyrium rufum]|nr:hypothetical protein [Agyrium rufum]